MHLYNIFYTLIVQEMGLFVYNGPTVYGLMFLF